MKTGVKPFKHDSFPNFMNQLLKKRASAEISIFLAYALLKFLTGFSLKFSENMEKDFLNRGCQKTFFRLLTLYTL